MIGLRNMVSLQCHDVFRYRGLGKTGFELWIWLLKQTHPTSMNEAIKQTTLSRATIFRKIKDMSICGMVKRDGELWEAVKDVDLNRAAQIMGTAGFGLKQKGKHRRERAENKQKRESF